MLIQISYQSDTLLHYIAYLIEDDFYLFNLASRLEPINPGTIRIGLTAIVIEIDKKSVNNIII